MTKIRILLVDDQAIPRIGLRLFLDTQPDMEVVGEAEDSRTALSKARKLQPDVIVLEIRMANDNGLQLIQQLLLECLQTRVVILTVYDDQANARSALAAGGSAYVVKRSDPADFLSAIRSVYRGHCFIDRSLADHVLEGLMKRSGGRSTKSSTSRSLLSPRECEVLILLAQGYTHRQIAEKIHVGVKSVETYRRRITEKLELHGRAELVRYAHECGLLTPVGFLSDSGHRAIR